MKKKLFITILTLLIIAIIYVAYVNLRPAKPAIAPQSSGTISNNIIEKGKYLTEVSDCMACHTQSEKEPFAGGVALETDFGTIISPNITPDKETGIGSWSDSDFLNAVKYGLGKNHTFLYPAMPYPAYAKVSDDDVLAIKAYLDTVTPIKRENAENNMPFPFNIRLLVLGWNTLFFDKDGFQPNELKSDEWNRGAYLVEGMAHCGTCHTPKNMFGADQSDKLYQGLNLQGWFAPDITANKHTGIGNWNEEDFIGYLKTGHSRFGAASGPMKEAVVFSTQHINNEDLKAMYTYLSDSKPSDETRQNITATQASLDHGKKLYFQQCSVCHGLEGEGIDNMVPGFAGNSHLQAKDLSSIVRVILEGSQSPITAHNPTGAAMPSFNWNLNDQQIADLLSYLRNNFGNTGDAVNAESIKKIRDNLNLQ